MRRDYRDWKTALIEDIYECRRLRPLIGEDSILIKALGIVCDGDSIGDEQPLETRLTYYDSKKRRHEQTELAEALEALKNFDSERSDLNAVALYLEVADLTMLRDIVGLHYRQDPLYKFVICKLNEALAYFKKELSLRDLPPRFVEKLMRAKYKVRLLYDSSDDKTGREKAELESCIEMYRKLMRERKK